MVLKMDEYINRGTAIAKLTALEVTEPNATMADAKRMLADMQTADVASVVRCKDCSWYQSVDDDGDDFEVCNYYNREVMGSQFCSEAEPYKTPEEKAEFRRSVGLDDGVAMAEYINRKALLKKAWDADTRIGYVQVVDVGDILDMPVADVAPVVRCKDCKYRDGTPGQPNILCAQMHEEDFCSYGECREDKDG